MTVVDYLMIYPYNVSISSNNLLCTGAADVDCICIYDHIQQPVPARTGRCLLQRGPLHDNRIQCGMYVLFILHALYLLYVLHAFAYLLVHSSIRKCVFMHAHLCIQTPKLYIFADSLVCYAW